MMKIIDTFESLDNSWSREKVLLKIKKGKEPEEIVDEYLSDNRDEIKKLFIFLKAEDKRLLTHIETLSTCEAILINKINNFCSSNNEFSYISNRNKNIPEVKKENSYKLGLFMMKWSNKFIFATLIIISAIALTKQAWA